MFLSYEDADGSIYGFLRLAQPRPRRAQAGGGRNPASSRELHVYGTSLGIGTRGDNHIQHSGLGRSLMGEAERISEESLARQGLLVISAVGTRRYYQKIGYSLYGPYMSKTLG